jgi:LPXTG-motif cell wall-anchored protein
MRMAAGRSLLIAGSTSLLLALVAGPAQADTTVHAVLQPLNGSGAGGVATLTATDAGRLIVVIHAHGLVPGQPHAQHIHGSLEGGGHFMCPSSKDDTNGDGILTNEEATGEYGTLFFSLTTRGDFSAKSGLALNRMPVADSHGRLNYRRSFPASSVPKGLLNHLTELHVVQHGIDVNHNDRYDIGALGQSTFAASLGLTGVPEEATDPADCGVVTGAGAPTAPHGGVETGGGVTGNQLNVTLAVAGMGLMGLSTLLLTRRRRAQAPSSK